MLIFVLFALDLTEMITKYGNSIFSFMHMKQLVKTLRLLKRMNPGFSKSNLNS